MNHRTKLPILLLSVLAAMLLSTLSCLAAEPLAIEGELTPALSVLSNDLTLVKSGLVGNDLTFSPDDFEECLGVKKVSEVMITSLPDVTVGALKLGDTTVIKNQVIARSRLDELCFTALKNESVEASFTFRAIGSEEYELNCKLYLLNSVNYRPSIDTVSTAKASVITFQNIATYRRLGASDPENDRLCFEITSYPDKGVITLIDRNLGDYVYTPITDYTGKDAFSYRVYDCYGNVSEEKTVRITVEENEACVVYSDLIGERAMYPALRLTAAGITDVRYENGSAVFTPAESVSRLDFLVMAMKAAGYNVSTTVEKTIFVDDDQIDPALKGYVSAAVNMGFISGIQTENGLCFCPNSPISRSDAAVILTRMVKIDTPTVLPVFSDADDIPTYAVYAVQALNHAGILECVGTQIGPMEVLDRAKSAEMLSALMDYIQLNQ